MRALVSALALAVFAWGAGSTLAAAAPAGDWPKGVAAEAGGRRWALIDVGAADSAMLFADEPVDTAGDVVRIRTRLENLSRRRSAEGFRSASFDLEIECATGRSRTGPVTIFDAANLQDPSAVEPKGMARFDTPGDRAVARAICRAARLRNAGRSWAEAFQAERAANGVAGAGTGVEQ